jgi:hypothetical protein
MTTPGSTGYDTRISALRFVHALLANDVPASFPLPAATSTVVDGSVVAISNEPLEAFLGALANIAIISLTTTAVLELGADSAQDDRRAWARQKIADVIAEETLAAHETDIATGAQDTATAPDH